MCCFDRERANRYEDWFDSPFGRRADRVEKGILQEFLSDFGDVGSLLEVGCGTGHFTRWFRQRGLATAGIDVSPHMLQVAKRSSPGIDLALGDARWLPCRDASFDVVALITVLEFVEAPQRAVAEALRVARRGLLLGALNSLSPIALWRMLRGTGEPGTYRWARFFSPFGLTRLVRGVLGGKGATIRWKTGLYPVSWLDGCTALPFGAFVGMSVRLGKGD